jgi:hypothetical protein
MAKVRCRTPRLGSIFGLAAGHHRPHPPHAGEGQTVRAVTHSCTIAVTATRTRSRHLFVPTASGRVRAGLRPRRPTGTARPEPRLAITSEATNPTDLVQRVRPGQQEHLECSKNLMVLPMTACSIAASAAKLTVSRAAFASAAQPGGGEQRRTQSRADGGGQRVQAADQQAPALDLRGPGCGVLVLVPAGTARLNPMSQARGWRGAYRRQARGLVTCTVQWRIRARSGPHDNHR